ncbi:MAG: hydrogenase formation protein HypD [Zoogloeaceae bacterium]|nr:hydrogenase formation protein HypD [Zoogloeaceae bacterium]
MNYLTAFRDGNLAATMANAIREAARNRPSFAFMEFCGGHTHAIARHGLLDLLPPSIRMIHGPGCPVCVLPIGRLDMAIDLALGRPGLILCTYGDCLRVPASGGRSLFGARAQGADVRMVYSPADALALARSHPRRQVVFLAIGFETTTPPTAAVVQAAAREGRDNFSVLCNHVLTPPAMAAILASGVPSGGGGIDGIVGPGHVSTVTGGRAFMEVSRRYRKPVVIAGFEPLDLLQAVLMLVSQVNEGRADVENEFSRGVTADGNRRAQALVQDVFILRETFEWRGLGEIPESALRLHPRYAAWDAEARFGLVGRRVADAKACECGAILRGEKGPTDCRIFGTACTPETPVGACMVSAEGACAAHFHYGRFRPAPVAAAGA